MRLAFRSLTTLSWDDTEAAGDPKEGLEKRYKIIQIIQIKVFEKGLAEMIMLAKIYKYEGLLMKIYKTVVFKHCNEALYF